MTRQVDRRDLSDAITTACAAGARLTPACAEAGIDARTFQRWRAGDGEVQADRRPTAARPTPSHALSELERARIVAVANEPRFAAVPPARIVPALADEGRYLASEASFHRVLRDHGQMRRRGRARPPRPVGPPSTHVAAAPGQVWCWDVTYLPSRLQGGWFYLYVILDLFSRKIVGHEVHETDQAEHAAHLVRRTALAEGIHAHARRPVLHGDNGPSMKGTTVLAMLYWLGIAPSHSRPRVSDDNAYAEALFRTASTARTSPPQALPISPERGSGRPISCTGTTTSTVTAASATSPRRNAMPEATVPCWPPATSCTSKHARPTRAAGVGRPATGRRSAPSRSTPSATASWPPQASGQRHPPSGRHSNHAQDRRPCYETSAATRLTRTAMVTALACDHGATHKQAALP